MSEQQVNAGRVALVTGGSRGIGAAIAAALAQAGYRVAATSRSGKAPDGVLPVVCDVTDSESVDHAFTTVEEQLGPVEVLVANAGVTRDGLLARMKEDDFTSVVDTNLTGTYRVVRRAARGMTRARFGRIVAISSVVGLLGSAGQVNYAASKSAMIGSGPLGGPGTGVTWRHREPRRSRIHQHRHDRRAAGEDRRELSRTHPRQAAG